MKVFFLESSETGSYKKFYPVCSHQIIPKGLIKLFRYIYCVVWGNLKSFFQSDQVNIIPPQAEFPPHVLLCGPTPTPLSSGGWSLWKPPNIEKNAHIACNTRPPLHLLGTHTLTPSIHLNLPPLGSPWILLTKTQHSPPRHLQTSERIVHLPTIMSIPHNLHTSSCDVWPHVGLIMGAIKIWACGDVLPIQSMLATMSEQMPLAITTKKTSKMK